LKKGDQKKHRKSSSSESDDDDKRHKKIKGMSSGSVVNHIDNTAELDQMLEKLIAKYSIKEVYKALAPSDDSDSDSTQHKKKKKKKHKKHKKHNK